MPQPQTNVRRSLTTRVPETPAEDWRKQTNQIKLKTPQQPDSEGQNNPSKNGISTVQVIQTILKETPIT